MALKPKADKANATTGPLNSLPPGDIFYWERPAQKKYWGRMVKIVTNNGTSEAKVTDVKSNKTFTFTYDDTTGETWAALPSTFQVCATDQFGIMFVTEAVWNAGGVNVDAANDPKFPSSAGLVDDPEPA
jgi:hypothetical protein